MEKSDQPKVLLSNLAFGESPRWHGGQLWVSDWGTQDILAVKADGTSENVVHLELGAFQAICMDWQPDGRMLIVSSNANLLLRRETDGAVQSFAKLSRSSGLGFNEIVVDGRGNAYVNGGGSFSPGADAASGIIVLVTPDGTARQMADGLVFPNGMCITPDNSTLIVAESQGNRLRAFAIEKDGSLSNERIWADLPGGYPDGICLDAEGAVWYADVANKCCVRVREGGEVLQTIKLDRGCFACMLGGADRKTLYMVAREWKGIQHASGGPRTGQVLSVAAPAAGAGWP